MENEIKVNEYVRTKKHGIFKVEKIRKTPYGYLCGTTDNEKVPTFTIGKGGTAEIKNDIVKHSHNLIDLISEGDYVNGVWINEIKNGKPCYEDGNDSFYDIIFENEDIETIVTKEMLESITYKVIKM